jgi:hypothetical protein
MVKVCHVSGHNARIMERLVGQEWAAMACCALAFADKKVQTFDLL